MASAPSGAGAIAAFGTVAYKMQAAQVLATIQVALDKMGLRLRNSNFSGPSFEYVGAKPTVPGAMPPAAGWQASNFAPVWSITESIAMIDSKFDEAFRASLEVRTAYDGAMMGGVPHWERSDAASVILNEYINLNIAAGSNVVTGRAAQDYQDSFDAEGNKSVLLQQIIDKFNAFFVEIQGKLSTHFQYEVQQLIADQKVSQGGYGGFGGTITGTMTISPTASTYDWTKYGIKRWLGVDV